MDGAAELERAYRAEATQIRAALAARLGDVGLAEELVQDAFVAALEHWRTDGVPANPGGWLATTARRKGIDRLRRERARREKLALLAVTEPPQAGLAGGPAGAAAGDADADGQDGAGDLLGLIFACCHPALSRESQVALTLRAVCGLTTTEIAAAFLAAEPAMTQRLSRARKALRECGEPVRVPGWGRLIRLADQDRARWDRTLITEAAGLLTRAMSLRRPGPYQLQAAIAVMHAQAASYGATDWPQIRLLYDRLLGCTPTPVVRLNRAVATRYAVGPQAALAEVEPLAAERDGYRLYHAVRAGLLTALGRDADARTANERALALAGNPAERELLTRRLSL
jgi:RNA polymerase sigma-70 factor (ECF subfamily)